MTWGLEGLFPRWLTHMAVGRGPQFFSRNLLEGSSDQEVVFLQNECSKAESEEEATVPSVAYCLKSHTISAFSYLLRYR